MGGRARLARILGSGSESGTHRQLGVGARRYANLQRKLGNDEGNPAYVFNELRLDYRMERGERASPRRIELDRRSLTT